MAMREGTGRRLRWTTAMIAEAYGQARLPFRDLAQIRASQDRRVLATVRYAHAHVPFYRETMRRRLISPSEIRTAADLPRLPLIERTQLQSDPEYFCSTLWSPRRCTALNSGGSAGAPVTVFRDPPSMLLEAAHVERLRSLVARLAGRRLRYREATIVPPDSSVASAIAALKRTSQLPTGARVDRRSFSMFRAPAELIEDLAAHRPDVISAYGSYLEELLREIGDRGWPGRLPKVAIYQADGVSESLGRWARDTLGVTVLGLYEAIETPLIGFECDENRGYHHNLDLCALRLVDDVGETVAPGAQGRTIASNLVNRGTVLLNYLLDDLVTVREEPCPCGRKLPLLTYPERGKAAWLELGGVRVHAQALRQALRHEPALTGYQIVQETDTSLLVRLVAVPECDHEAVWSRVSARMTPQLPPGVRLRRAFVQELPRTAAGKLQAVVPLAFRR